MPSVMKRHPMTRQAQINRENILAFMRDHPGARYKEIARGTGLSIGAIRDHVTAIRQEWIDRCASQASTLKHGEPTQLMLFNLGEHEAAMRGSQPRCSKRTASED